MRARRLRWSSIHCSEALAKTRSSPSSSQVAMSPCREREPGHVGVGRLGPGQHGRGRVDAHGLLGRHLLVQDLGQVPRATARDRRCGRLGTGWHRASRSSNGCWRSERNRSYWSGLHPSIGVTVTALMSTPSRDARRPRAARPAATPRLTWENGSPAAPVSGATSATGRDDGTVAANRAGARRASPSSGSRATSSTVSRLPRNVVQARPRRTTRVSSSAGRVQSRWRSSLVILSATVTSPSWGTGSGRPATPPCQRVHHQRAADGHQLFAERGQCDVVVDRHGAHGVDGTGVEPLLHLHEAHTGLVVAGEDGPLDRAPRRASAAAARSAGSPSAPARAAGPG